jgi:hypothetical protein
MRCANLFAAAIAVSLGAPLVASGDTVARASSSPLPARLRDTGLFVEESTVTVRADVLPFSPQYPLWSDGTTKRRWIYLPPSTFVDARRPGAWEFPPGTRLWKEFSLGRRVETRFIERLADGSWRYATYVWNDDGSDAILASPQGVPAVVSSRAHDKAYTIPSESDCRACHEGAAVPVLGFSALQLSPDRDPLAVHAEPPAPGELDLRAIVERGWLRNLPRTLVETPPRIAAASGAERAALGYLHGNCGHCHSNPGDSDASVPVGLVLAQDITDPTSTNKVLRSLIAASDQFRLPGSEVAVPLVVPGESHASALVMRMRSRDAHVQMPPLGTSITDSAGLALIARWIDQDMKKPKE